MGKGLLGNRALWSALCKIHGHRPGEGASTGAGGEGSEVQEGGEPERLGELLAVSQCHEQEKDQKGQHSWVKPGYCLEGDRGNFGLCPESRASVTELSCTLSLTLSARGPGCRRLGRKKWGMHWREDACKVAVAHRMCHVWWFGLFIRCGPDSSARETKCRRTAGHLCSNVLQRRKGLGNLAVRGPGERWALETTLRAEPCFLG